MKKDSTTAIGTEKISKLLLRFTASTLAALLFNSLYTLLDALLVSWGVGDNAMGSVSIVFPFVVLQGAVSMAVGAGAASIVSRRLGEGKKEKAGEATINALVIFYSTAFIVTVVGLIFTAPILNAFGVTDELYEASRQYFVIMLLGNVFSTGFSSIIRAEGKMKYALLIWIIPISINVVLDIFFIFGLGLGVVGSALGTVIGQFISFSMSILFWIKFSNQSFRGVKINVTTMKEIVATGLPSLIQMGSISIISLVQNNVLRDISGTIGVNTFAFMSKVITFFIMPFTAVAQALAPIAGYNYGVKKLDRVKETINLSMVLQMGYAFITFVILMFGSNKILHLFTDNAEIIEFGTSGLKIIALSLFSMPFSSLLGAAFQALGHKRNSFYIFLSMPVLLVPLTILMGNYFGMDGVWWAYPIANFGSAIFAFAFMRKLNKGLRLQ